MKQEESEKEIEENTKVSIFAPIPTTIPLNLVRYAHLTSGAWRICASFRQNPRICQWVNTIQ